MDKAGRAYWDDLWTAQTTPRITVSPQPKSISYLQKRFRRFFSEVLSGVKTDKAKLLEAGCGNSAWLPCFASEFGFAVSGIDYSQKGCEQARALLSNQSLPGEIVCADLFQPPERMRSAFDVVFSLDVVEHFTDTAACLTALAAFLKPGGLIITSIPNMRGLCGFFQRLLNRPVFDVHVPLDTDALRAAHEQAGLQVLTCDYFMSTNFGVISLNGVDKQSIKGWLKKVAVAVLIRLSYCFWIIEDLVGPVKAHSISSPYLNCVARKPEGHQD